MELRGRSKQNKSKNSRGESEAGKYLLKTNLKSLMGNSELNFITVIDAVF